MVPYFPPYIGGQEIYVKMLSEELAERGHDVVVFTSSDTSYSYEDRVNGVEICRLKVLSKFYNVPIAPSLFRRLLQEWKPDIVHAHQYPVFFSDLSALVYRFKRTPFLLHIHIISNPKSFFSHLLSSLYYGTAGRFTINCAQAIITPSSAYKSLLSGKGVAPDKIKVVPYGIDLGRFHPNNDGSWFKKKYGCDGSRVILSVGRLNYQKGFSYLIKAMPNVLRHFSDVKLVIVGEGEDLAYLRGISKRLGLEESILFTGAMSSSEIPEAYAAADVFVLPSIFESFGIVLIEAQATGKPVVCTRVGGVPEAVVDGKTGLMVEPQKPDELTNAIIAILSDRKMAKSIGERGRRYVEDKFGWDSIVDEVVNLYEEAVIS